jgi:alkylhydroperoxidase family enzyme
VSQRCAFIVFFHREGFFMKKNVEAQVKKEITMRLAPIEKPRNLFVRIAYWWSTREFGKVIMPLKVIYARKPQMMFLAGMMSRFEEKSVSLEPALKLLIKTFASALNNCEFCRDIALAQAVKKELGADKFTALGDGAENRPDIFSEKELVVLKFVKEYADGRKISDATFAGLRELFSETEIVEITAINAIEQYYNACSIPLGIGSDNLRKFNENQNKIERTGKIEKPSFLKNFLKIQRG